MISEYDPKSSGSENTFASDLVDLDEIRGHIAEMARGAAGWLTRREFFARTVTIKVRYHDFTTITRSHSDAPTRDEASIVHRALTLLDKTEAGRRPIRLLGASVSNLCATIEPLVVREPRLPFDEIVNDES